MKHPLLLCVVTSFFLLFANTYKSLAQILSYTTATDGSLSFVAPNANGTGLTYVNGAAPDPAPCGTGFSAINFLATTSYSSSLEGVEVSVSPNAGFSLNVTGFTVDLSRSGTGPALVRFAYSIDGGSNWIDEGSDETVHPGPCSKSYTVSWQTTFTLTAPNKLIFRLYGFDAGKTSGSIQISNLNINGSVSPAASTCGVATALTAASITSTSATLDWADVSGANSYNIQYRKTGTTAWTSGTSSTSTSAISGLSASTTYEFQVQTVCSGGTSAFSSSATFTTAAPACGIATALTATTITSSSATLDWADVSGANSYNIQYRKTGTTAWTIGTSSTSTLAISGLSASTTYEFQVQTVCSGGNSAFSSSATFTTSAPACGVATALTATTITSSSATLDWADVSGASSYNIQYRKTGTTTWTSGTSSISTLAISGLSSSTTYEFQVQTVCSGGASAFSSSTTFTTAAPACGIATALTTTNITSSSATLDWADVSGASSYNTQYRKTGTTAWTSGTSSISTLAISGLSASTSYEFQVQTVCSGGNSAFSSSATFTTAAATVTKSVPAFSHIVIVIGENSDVSSVFGNSSAPYINALAAAGAKFTNSYAIEHPSQPNYLDLYSGGNQGITDNTYITTKFTTANLGRELINVGKTYATYSEGLPSVGYDGASSGNYARKHNPAANWMGTGTNQISTSTNQPFTAFPSNYNNLPSVSFVVPDLCGDGHNTCAPLNNQVLQFDNWVQTNLDAYKQWCVNNNSLLIVTYDEDDNIGNGNKIATVFYGANVVTGVYSQTINHFNVLRTMEDAFGSVTHAGAAASATPINFCWTASSLTASKSQPTLMEETTNADINIFPNPASSKITVLLNAKFNENVNWEITNMKGVEFKKGKLNSNATDKLEISLDNLSNGVYIFRATDGKNTRLKKFVIAK